MTGAVATSSEVVVEEEVVEADLHLDAAPSSVSSAVNRAILLVTARMELVHTVVVEVEGVTETGAGHQTAAAGHGRDRLAGASPVV